MPLTKTIEEIGERFDKSWDMNLWGYVINKKGTTQENRRISMKNRQKEIKSFLSQAMQSAREATLGEVEEAIEKEAKNINSNCKKGHGNVAQCIMQECKILSLTDIIKELKQK